MLCSSGGLAFIQVWTRADREQQCRNGETMTLLGSSGPVGSTANPVQTSPHSLWSQHTWGTQGSPASPPWRSRFYPWSVFGLLLPSSHTPWFSLMLMRFSYPHMVHAVMNLIQFIIWKEKKTFSSEIQGTNLPLELLIRPNTWDADPFSAEPISIQSHPGVPCFESRT